MTKRDFISVFIKIVGILLPCSMIINILFLFISRATGLTISICIVVALIGFFLILAADKIAGKLVPTNKELKIIGGNITPKDVFTVVLQIIGMTWIIFGLEYFVKMVLGIEQNKENWIISNLLLIFIGVYFVSGAKHIVKIMFDRKPKQTENSAPPVNT